jgi:hypothetical protein
MFRFPSMALMVAFQAFQGKELTAEWLFIASFVPCSLFCY